MLDGWRNQHLSCGHQFARFESWIAQKLDGLPPHGTRPVEQVAAWHHLRRIRVKAAANDPTRGRMHAASRRPPRSPSSSAWLHETHVRTAATCTQQDIDAWLASGPTTRSLIMTFFVFAGKTDLNTGVTVQHRAARTQPL